MPNQIDNAPVSMSAFFTREKANTGIKIPLKFPNGKDSGYFIRIRGTDSDAFREAEITSKRAMMLVAEKTQDVEEINKELSRQTLIVIASLIIDWNLAEPCTEENKIIFLTEAPQIADSINNLANKRAVFSAGGLHDFLNIQKPTSNSASPLPEATSHSSSTSTTSGNQQDESPKN